MTSKEIQVAQLRPESIKDIEASVDPLPDRDAMAEEVDIARIEQVYK